MKRNICCVAAKKQPWGLQSGLLFLPSCRVLCVVLFRDIFSERVETERV